jgi:hypothetical protein
LIRAASAARARTVAFVILFAVRLQALPKRLLAMTFRYTAGHVAGVMEVAALRELEIGQLNEWRHGAAVRVWSNLGTNKYKGRVVHIAKSKQCTMSAFPKEV